MTGLLVTEVPSKAVGALPKRRSRLSCLGTGGAYV